MHAIIAKRQPKPEECLRCGRKLPPSLLPVHLRSCRDGAVARRPAVAGCLLPEAKCQSERHSKRGADSRARDGVLRRRGFAAKIHIAGAMAAANRRAEAGAAIKSPAEIPAGLSSSSSSSVQQELPVGCTAEEALHEAAHSAESVGAEVARTPRGSRPFARRAGDEWLCLLCGNAFRSVWGARTHCLAICTRVWAVERRKRSDELRTQRLRLRGGAAISAANVATGRRTGPGDVIELPSRPLSAILTQREDSSPARPFVSTPYLPPRRADGGDPRSASAAAHEKWLRDDEALRSAQRRRHSLLRAASDADKIVSPIFARAAAATAGDQLWTPSVESAAPAFDRAESAPFDRSMRSEQTRAAPFDRSMMRSPRAPGDSMRPEQTTAAAPFDRSAVRSPRALGESWAVRARKLSAAEDAERERVALAELAEEELEEAGRTQTYPCAPSPPSEDEDGAWAAAIRASIAGLASKRKGKRRVW
eukprot:TRINITY_DN17748_c0_g1_i2.p1 TRINITY_DN17748_c0_g1~~TRINITY_DN17748_c0_g1_i2.p1  ORF type:complete len:494 (+),score=108.58 TRINITY_DN17748_c0_g1_i2:50-1483(+)